MKLELVPPGCHRRNAAEVAIRNFKAHFLSVLAGTVTSFPPNLWDRILPQAKVTINLFRQSNATPNVSAYAHLSGPFEYNKMPLAPMGCESQVHEKTEKRGTWVYHSVDGWYLDTSPEHYCTHLFHIKTKNSEIFTDTAQFSHHKITKPAITHAENIMAAMADCNKAINNMDSNDGADELKQLMKLTEKTIKNNEQTQASPRVHTPLTPNSKKLFTRSMFRDIPQVPGVTPTAVPRVDNTTKIEPPNFPPNNQLLAKHKACRRRHAQTRSAVSNSAPSRNK